MSLNAIRRELKAAADPERAKFVQGYFQTGKGEYGEGDRFLGVTVPALRRHARTHRDAALADVRSLLRSRWHEERALALLILVDRYRRGTEAERAKIFALYLAHTEFINNWDLVDSSAEYVVGAHQRPGDKKLLAKSDSVWERRIAVLASRAALKRGDFAPTLMLARALLDDTHDLIHKAVGWMLREIADKDRKVAEAFLRQHGERMPRTMLRYAIEKFPPLLRKKYLSVRPSPPSARSGSSVPSRKSSRSAP